MEQKRFSKLDDGFTCVHCGREVKPLGYSSRNHCPFCLWSRHVDINPGDRANPCGGDLEPISATDFQESSPTPQFKSINSLVCSFLHSPTLTSIHDY